MDGYPLPVGGAWQHTLVAGLCGQIQGCFGLFQLLVGRLQLRSEPDGLSLADLCLLLTQGLLGTQVLDDFHQLVRRLGVILEKDSSRVMPSAIGLQFSEIFQ